VRRGLRSVPSAVQKRYLELLELRLRALESLATGRRASLALTASNRVLSRRFLEPFEDTWDDGDENLVRGFLDRWLPSAAPPIAYRAARLLEAASQLARMDLRPGTLWFFLWEMESMLPDLTSRQAERKGW
jgi:hypothetical protein